jgi:hypothetical protein
MQRLQSGCRGFACNRRLQSGCRGVACNRRLRAVAERLSGKFATAVACNRWNRSLKVLTASMVLFSLLPEHFCNIPIRHHMEDHKNAWVIKSSRMKKTKPRENEWKYLFYRSVTYCYRYTVYSIEVPNFAMNACRANCTKWILVCKHCQRRYIKCGYHISTQVIIA